MKYLKLVALWLSAFAVCGLITIVAVALAEDAESAAPVKAPTYDYEIEAVDKSECPHDYIRCIQQRGEDGWRLHTVDINLGVAIYEKEEK